jgi:hypothetical protein
VLRRRGLVARRPDGTWLLPHEGGMAHLQSLNGDLAELTVA